MDRSWSRRLKAFAQSEGSDVADAAVLLMPLVKFISPTAPSVAIHPGRTRRQPGVRFAGLPVQPAGQPGRGARGRRHLLGVLVLVRRGAHPRRALDEARLAFEKMLTYANHLGLYAEQISRTGQQQGNFPQALGQPRPRARR